LPSFSDGALLFLQLRLVSLNSTQPEIIKNGSRLAIVLTGSALFTGDAGVEK
jgi:type I restriction-modification system DNA methylase subunit